MDSHSAFSEFHSILLWLKSRKHLPQLPNGDVETIASFQELPVKMEKLSQARVSVQEGLDRYFSDYGERVARLNQDYDQAMNLAKEFTETALRLQEGFQSNVPTVASAKISTSDLLPELVLPKFGGSLHEWSNFINLFDSMVHRHSEVDAALKMCYLVTSLTDEALGLVKHLSITSANYLKARELLFERYQNTRLLANIHIADILSLPAVTRITDLQHKLLDPLMVAINALKNLKLPVDQWSYLLFYLVQKKIPFSLRLRFEQSIVGDSTQLPDFDRFLQFLERECRLTFSEPESSLNGESTGVGRQRR